MSNGSADFIPFNQSTPNQHSDNKNLSFRYSRGSNRHSGCNFNQSNARGSPHNRNFNSKFRHRNSGASKDVDISQYIHPSMLENPWQRLEEYFDCPTDEILIKSSPAGSECGNGELSTICDSNGMSSATLATQTFVSEAPGTENNESSNLEKVTVGAETRHNGDVIVIPATPNSVQLQQAIQQVSANGVTVLNVGSLQDEEDSSGHSTPEERHGTVVVQAADGGHYITVSGDGSGSGVGYHVQYVEPQELYTQPQQAHLETLRAYPVYTVSEGSAGGDNTVYATSGAWANATAYQTPAEFVLAAPTQATHATPHQTSPQNDACYSSGGGAEGADSELAADEAGLTLASAPRAPPATVQWLLENYETADGVSMPRSTLYSHYLRHCSQQDLEPVNAASFGKLIRSVFLGLRTRRLGTRGNSKYHYYGIRVKPGSALASGLVENKVQSRWGPARQSQCPRGEPDDGGGEGGEGGDVGGGSAGEVSPNVNRQFLGDGARGIPDTPHIVLTGPLPGDCTLEDVDTLRGIYHDHCEAFLEAVLALELGTVEQLWQEFWRHTPSDDCEEEKYLSKAKLYQLCSTAEVQHWVRSVDVAFYQLLVEVLLPDVLRPIPTMLTQCIRNFAKGLEQWLAAAMSGCPAGLVRAKAGPAAALAAALRRHTSLNHLAQAARAVLHNAHQIQQMLADLNRVDFRNVQEQAAWACRCRADAVAALEADFKATLARQASLEQWAAWLEGVVRRALEPHEHAPDYAQRARQFLLKWSFYSSMVIRDLTLRSAASFGSFHLIRLLYDEYVFYLIEQRVAAHTGLPAITVMAAVNLESDSESGLSTGQGAVDVGAETLTHMHASAPKKQKIEEH